MRFLTVMLFCIGLLPTVWAGGKEREQTPWRNQPEGWPLQQFEAFYLRPDTPGVVPIAIPESWKNQTVHYTLKDYTGKAVRRESVACGDGLALNLTLPAGWYELVFDEMPGVTSGILVFPEVRKPLDPFFGINSFSCGWINQDRPELVRRIAGLMPLLGIANARICFYWRWGNPRPGVFIRDGLPAKFTRDELRAKLTLDEISACRELGTRVLVGLQRAPDYLKKSGFCYPTDYQGSLESFLHILRSLKGKLNDVEAWNEPDIWFGDYLPADRYAVIPKILAVARQRSGADVSLVGGVITHQMKRKFIEQMAANKVPELCDAMSFHSYEPPSTLAGKIGEYRKFLPPGTPLWLTESGGYYRNTGKINDYLALTREQENLIALRTASIAAEAKALGIARCYPFIFCYYTSSTERGGLTKRDLTPARGIAAYAQLIHATAHKEYTGELKLADPKAMARCFGGNLAVIYTDEPESQPTVELPFTPVKIRGIDGRGIPVSGRRVTVSDGMIYVYAPENIAVTVPPPEPSGARHTAIKAPPLLLAPEFPEGAAGMIPSQGWAVDAERALPVIVTAANFGAEPLSGELTAAFEGTNISRTVPFSIAAGTLQRFSLKFSPEELKKLPGQVMLRFSAPNALPAVCSVRLNSVKKWLECFRRSVPLPIRDVKRWEKNQRNGSWRISSDADGVKMAFAFDGPGLNWALPAFHIPPDIGFAGAAGLVIRARIGKDTGQKVTTQLSLLDPCRYRKDAIISTNGAFDAVFVGFDELSAWQGATLAPPKGRKIVPEDIRTLYFGVERTMKTETTLEISDIYVVWK